MKRHLSRTRVLAIVVTLAVTSAGAWSFAQNSHGHSQGHDHGHRHDMANMPGLIGANASAEESAEIAVLFRGFETMTRAVENLPDGIKTTTSASDPAVRDALISHVVGMIDRVDQGNDPQIRIQSPTLDIFFLRGDTITSDLDITDDGVIVIQTSDDPDVVAALHTHAAEVSAMTERGMDAVHDMMMARGTGH